MILQNARSHLGPRDATPAMRHDGPAGLGPNLLDRRLRQLAKPNWLATNITHRCIFRQFDKLNGTQTTRQTNSIGGLQSLPFLQPKWRPDATQLIQTTGRIASRNADLPVDFLPLQRHVRWLKPLRKLGRRWRGPRFGRPSLTPPTVIDALLSIIRFAKRGSETARTRIAMRPQTIRARKV